MKNSLKTTRADYDYAPLPALRVVTNFIRWKMLPVGYMERGPGIVWLISIAIRHRFGRQMTMFKIKHPKGFARTVRLRQKLASLAHR